MPNSAGREYHFAVPSHFQSLCFSALTITTWNVDVSTCSFSPPLPFVILQSAISYNAPLIGLNDSPTPTVCLDPIQIPIFRCLAADQRGSMDGELLVSVIPLNSVTSLCNCEVLPCPVGARSHSESSQGESYLKLGPWPPSSSNMLCLSALQIFQCAIITFTGLNSVSILQVSTGISSLVPFPKQSYVEAPRLYVRLGSEELGQKFS